MNKKYLIDKARTLYVNELETFISIAQQLKVHERTLRMWAKKENWDKQRDEVLEKSASILDDRMEIAVMLGKKIKALLSKGKEPSAAMLNAYRGITENLNKIKDFEQATHTSENIPSSGLSEQTKHAIAQTFQTK